MFHRISNPTPACACPVPTTWDIDAAFDLTANGVYHPADAAPVGGIHAVPPSILKAIGWVESNWRQFSTAGNPVVSPDFGYGIMQVTSGMAGAFGDPTGDLDPSVQTRIASQYRFNIAYGLRILSQKWAATPRIGAHDPSVVEDWYYALWAYNGWGWVNNPNNPRFTREGTPATDPATYPYQERVLYLVAHPPHDAEGNPLWAPVSVTLPSRAQIGNTPGPYVPRHTHRQAPESLAAVYEAPANPPLAPGKRRKVTLHLIDTGTQPWLATGPNAVTLTYHLMKAGKTEPALLSPFTPGVIAFGQGTAPLPHDVLPGHRVTVHAVLTAPLKPGRYRVVWDAQIGAGSWFDQAGVAPRGRPLTVSAKPATPTPDPATPTPEPLSGLRYLADTAAPDGTVVAAGKLFTKGWLVLNNGTQPWSDGWVLVHVSGPAFGAAEIPVPATSACYTANILATLRAPKQPGTYVGSWQLESPGGTPAGDPLTANVVVQSSAPVPTPIPTATATPTPGPATPTPTPVG